ncbi:MAG TPA: hypothetical protein VNN07_05545, partial [Candidatus Tectomicrobia bacterium]|nr:hypothetical protein [Candidatus Tectomicrobia bacterium]
LTERLVGESIRQTSRYLVNGAVLAAAVLVGIAGVVVGAPLPAARPAWADDLTRTLGEALVGAWAVPLQLLGVLLVVALLGALYFARTDT